MMMLMNKQRVAVYTKRRHALMGERIGMDIANIIWDRVLNIVNNNDFFRCQGRVPESSCYGDSIQRG